MPRFALSTLLAIVAAFLAGLAVGRFTLPHPPNVAASLADEVDSLGEDAPVRLVTSFTPTPSGKLHNGHTSASTSLETVIAGLKKAIARPSDRHTYIEASKLIDGIDPKNVRAVIDAFQTLPNQREKSVYLGMLVAHWAESEPQAALAYAQTTGTASDRRMLVAAAVSAWAAKEPNAANAWVLQMPPGQDRDRALQSVVSSFAETNPEAALAMLQVASRRRKWPAKFLLADFFALGLQRSI